MTRLPTLSRAGGEQLPPLRLTGRDREIVQAVYEFRALLSRQLELLFFTPRPGGPRDSAPAGSGSTKINSRCLRRLQLLYHHGYLFRGEQARTASQGRAPLVYFLDARGKELLEEELQQPIAWSPSDNDVGQLFLQHLLATNDVRCAITVAARWHRFLIPDWIDDQALRASPDRDHVALSGPKGGKSRKVPILPDGYFVLETDDKVYHHFLEVDLGTIVGQSTRGRRDWRRRVRAYTEYVQSGKFKRRYGGRGLRVLTVTTSSARLENLKRVTEDAGGKNRWWFTTFDQLTPGAVLHKPIWRVATRNDLHSLVW